MSYYSEMRSCKWEVTSSRKLTEEEINAVDRAFVVLSDGIFIIEFHLKNGDIKHIPVYGRPIYVEQKIDLSRLNILHLQWNGKEESTIIRVQFEY